MKSNEIFQDNRKPDREFSAGLWTLQIFYRLKSTKSEGQHGVLLYDNKVIEPKQPYEVLETELGSIKYYLHPSEMQATFEITGWNFADSNRIRASWDKGDT